MKAYLRTVLWFLAILFKALAEKYTQYYLKNNPMSNEKFLLFIKETQSFRM